MSMDDRGMRGTVADTPEWTRGPVDVNRWWLLAISEMRPLTESDLILWSRALNDAADGVPPSIGSQSQLRDLAERTAESSRSVDGRWVLSATNLRWVRSPF